MHRKGPNLLAVLLAMTLALPFVPAGLSASVSAEPESSSLERSAPDQRVVVIGDSLSIGLGKEIERVFATRGDVALTRLGKVSSGLVKPDFFDWEKNAAKLGDQARPDVIVIMIGANDNNNLASPEGRTVYFTDSAWDEAYAARAARLVDACRAHNPEARVYWVGVPVMADPTLDRDVRRINAALETMCGRMQHCTFIDTRGVLADGEGRFAPLAASPSGEMTTLRLDDGVHVTAAGSRLLAARCLETIMGDLGMDASWRTPLVAEAGLRPVAAREAAPMQAADAGTISRPEVSVVEPDDATRHTVRAGETLWGIARRANVGMTALVAANPGMDPDRLSEGQVVRLPSQGVEVAAQAKDQEPQAALAAPAASRTEAASGAITEPVPTRTIAQAAPLAESGSYSVLPGDSVWTVAKKLGVSPRDLVRANAEIDPDRLSLGQVLRIPERRAVEVPAVQTAQAPAAADHGGYLVADGDNLWRIARRFGVTVAGLKKANAGVRPDRLKPGQHLNIPEAENVQAVSADRPEPGQTVTAADGATSYAVAGGDTPWTVAKRFGVSVEHLLAANAGINPRRLQIGQMLAIPATQAPDMATGRELRQDAEAVRVPIAKGDNLWTLARRYGLRVADLMASNQGLDPLRLEIGRELVIPSHEAAKAERERRDAAVEVSVRQDGSVRVYNVADGDTLWNLSRRFGVSVERILDANADVQPDRLEIGQVLQIPASVVASARF
jgi:LysM repeat protein